MTRPTAILDLRPTSIVRIAKRQVSTEVNDERIVLDVQDGVYYGLNPMASRIWELLGESRSVAELQGEILATYDVEPAQLGEDLARLLEQLRSWDLIDIEP
jgi:hypothetical protein